MKQYILAGLAAALMAGGLITAAAPASAGCQYGGIAVSKRDGPVQPDGTWQRCVVFDSMNSSSYSRVDRRCDGS
jgi:hypothetical protein